MKIILAAALLVLASTTRSDADVIARSLLFSVLDATHQLHREAPPSAEGDRRYYSVDDYGYLSSGADLLIVPLGSGGSGGVFETLLFTSIRRAPKFIGVIPSPNGHLSVTISEGAIVVSTPNYGSGDPNCCPSSRTFTTYSLVGIRLHKLSEYTEHLRT